MTENSPAMIGFPDRRAASRHWERVAQDFDSAAFVHAEARIRLLERLQFFKLSPSHVMDLGSGSGGAVGSLHALYPEATVAAVDLSASMTKGIRRRLGDSSRAVPVRADAERLPFADGSFDLVFANLLLPWCDPRVVFAEVARILRDGGLFLFTTVGPDTLQEVRRAWAEVDEAVHVHGFSDMHDIGDLAARAGLVEPVMDVDRMIVTYAEVEGLVRDLRACAATNVAFGRRPQLTGRARWQAFTERLEAQREQGRFPVSVELIFGQAWGSDRRAISPDGAVGITVEEIARSLPSHKRRDP